MRIGVSFMLNKLKKKIKQLMMKKYIYKYSKSGVPLYKTKTPVYKLGNIDPEYFVSGFTSDPFCEYIIK